MFVRARFGFGFVRRREDRRLRTRTAFGRCHRPSRSFEDPRCDERAA